MKREAHGPSVKCAECTLGPMEVKESESQRRSWLTPQFARCLCLCLSAEPAEVTWVKVEQAEAPRWPHSFFSSCQISFPSLECSTGTDCNRGLCLIAFVWHEREQPSIALILLTSLCVSQLSRVDKTWRGLCCCHLRLFGHFKFLETGKNTFYLRTIYWSHHLGVFAPASTVYHHNRTRDLFTS